tara:strand:+ start:1924 stop:2139 length:216 start_codon:yes stop_codon:yes gene_type:complete
MSENEFYQALRAAGFECVNELVDDDPLATYYRYGHGLYIAGPKFENIRPEHHEFVVEDFKRRVQSLLNGPH